MENETMSITTDTPSATTRARTRVLIVDDHPGMADTLARAVSKLGPDIEALSTTRSTQALEIVSEAAVDILITDLMMPDMTGLQLIEALQSHPAGRPSYVILITAYDVPGLKETARRLKLNETVIKPFRLEKISQIVGRALEEMGRSTPHKPSAGARLPHKVLIADDVPDNIALVARYLQNEGCQHLSAANGVEALEKARAEMPDLILLDINMPDMDGFEVLKQIRLDPAIAHLPVIFLTAARPDPIDIQPGLNLGADDYVIKPFDRRELMARIHTKLRVKEADDVIRRRNREMNVLLEIVKLSHAQPPAGGLMAEILNTLAAGMGARAGYYFGPGDRLQTTTTASVQEIDGARLRELALMLERAGGPVIVDDPSRQMPWLAAWDPDVQSAITVAVTDRPGSSLGSILLTHSQPGYFGAEQADLMRSLADQIAAVARWGHPERTLPIDVVKHWRG